MNLKVENLTRRYRGKDALCGANFELKSGSVCLLLGPNGSGKTTLMKMISGLVSPTQGRILLSGEPLRPASKAQVAYMPTENYFYNYMTVRDAGRYYADFFPDFDLNGFEAMAERGELPMNGRIRVLSSGMSAKLRLALALNRNAGLMMFDEPINGVDMLTREWVLDEIAARRSDDRILLISTHLVEEAEHLANCALFLRHGKLVRAGSMAEVCENQSLEDVYREIYGAHAEREEA